MLKVLRKQKVAKIIFYILAIIIIPAFIFWGSVSLLSEKSEKGYAGKIFGKKVSFEEYAHSLEGWRVQLRLQYGEQSRQLEEFLDANQATWDRLMLAREVKKRGIKVSDQELSNFITSLPALQKDGVFNKELYELFLRYVIGCQPRVFDEYMRQMLAFRKLFAQVTDDISLSEEEARKAYEEETRQIKIYYIAVPVQDYTDKITVTDEELAVYYQENPERFRLPLQIKVAFIGFDYPAGASQEQKQTIDGKLKELEQFLKDNNNDIGAAAEKFGAKSQETDFFSIGEPIPGLNWTPEDFEKIFNLEQNQLSESITTPAGPCLFLLKEKRTDYLPALSEITEKAKTLFIKEKARQMAKTRADEISGQIQAAKKSQSEASLKEIGQQLNISVAETDFFGKNTPIPDIDSSYIVKQKAFELEKNQISPAIESANTFYIIAVAQEKPFNQTEFDKSKEAIKETLLQEKKNQAFEAFLKDLQKRSGLVDLIPKQESRPQIPKQ